MVWILLQKIHDEIWSLLWVANCHKMTSYVFMLLRKRIFDLPKIDIGSTSFCSCSAKLITFKIAFIWQNLYLWSLHKRWFLFFALNLISKMEQICSDYKVLYVFFSQFSSSFFIFSCFFNFFAKSSMANWILIGFRVSLWNLHIWHV